MQKEQKRVSKKTSVTKKYCLEETELENKINQPEKHKVNIDSLREKQRIY